MKSIYQMELEDKFNRKIKYREKKLKNQRMMIGKQQEEIERLKEENNFLKLNNPQMNLEHFRVVKENKRKMDNLRQVNKRLNNIINKGIEAINVYQNEKTLSISYQDLKRIRGILQGNEFDLQMFEEYLQELKGDDK